MKKLLMIAPYFPPRRRVGSLRPFRFSINLGKFGWQPTVATLEAASDSLTSSEKGLLSRVNIVALRPSFDQTRSFDRPLSKTCFPGFTQRTSLLNFVATKIDRAFPIDTWLPVLMAHFWQLEKIVQRQRPAAIWSTADPWSSHVLAMRLAKRFDLPWVADFRDPWTLCPLRSGARASLAQICDQWAEKKILRNADRVVFTAKETQLVYENHYDFPLRATTIYNSFDGHISKRNAMPSSKSLWLELVFFGKFRGLSPATGTIRILHELKTQYPEVYPFVRMNCFGVLEDSDIRHAQTLGVLASFRCCSAVSPEESIEALLRFDILWLSADAKRREIVPAKLWDYLAAGRPILSISENPEVESILMNTESGIQINNPAQAAQLLQRSWQAKRDGLRLPIPFNEQNNAVEGYNAHHTTAALADILDEL